MDLQEQVAQLHDEVTRLKQIINSIVLPNRYLFVRDIELFNGKNIKVGTGTGTTFGQTGAKIGFLGKSAVVMQPNIPNPSGGATVDSQARSAITSIITTLQQFGLSTP